MSLEVPDALSECYEGGNGMRRVLTLMVASTLALVVPLTADASADPINSPRAFSEGGTLVCGDVTYTIVSPPGRTPAGQMLTADGSNSTSVQIMILDKAAAFPQGMLTDCMFTSPEQFEVQLLITPVQ
jgi:hypothetical protein